MAEQVQTGGCFCGQVRFEVWGAPENVRICHCTRCQRTTAAPFFARVLCQARQVTITGELGHHPSSPEMTRTFCPSCGTRVGTDRPASGNVALSLALFDDQSAFRPDCHFFVASKAPWLQLADGLPQYEEWPPD
jgi:hypothetical protein